MKQVGCDRHGSRKLTVRYRPIQSHASPNLPRLHLARENADCFCGHKPLSALLKVTRVMMATTVHGIPNCDTVKKARVWLDGQAVGYRFHNWKTDGVDGDVLNRAIAQHGWERVLNRQGTTFRKLPEEERASLDAATALRIMQEHPSTIKRPILVVDDVIAVGFSPDGFQQALEAAGRQEAAQEGAQGN